MKTEDKFQNDLADAFGAVSEERQETTLETQESTSQETEQQAEVQQEPDQQQQQQQQQQELPNNDVDTEQQEEKTFSATPDWFKEQFGDGFDSVEAVKNAMNSNAEYKTKYEELQNNMPKQADLDPVTASLIAWKQSNPEASKDQYKSFVEELTRDYEKVSDMDLMVQDQFDKLRKMDPEKATIELARKIVEKTNGLDQYDDDDTSIEAEMSRFSFKEKASQVREAKIAAQKEMYKTPEGVTLGPQNQAPLSEEHKATIKNFVSDSLKNQNNLTFEEKFGDGGVVKVEYELSDEQKTYRDGLLNSMLEESRVDLSKLSNEKRSELVNKVVEEANKNLYYRDGEKIRQAAVRDAITQVEDYYQKLIHNPSRPIQESQGRQANSQPNRDDELVEMMSPRRR